MRLVTLIHNLLPLLTTFLNHISMLILSSAFRSESKSGLFILKQKHPASEPALLSRECSVQRQQTQNPPGCQSTVYPSHFLYAGTTSSPKQPASSLVLEQNNPKNSQERVQCFQVFPDTDTSGHH